MSNTINLREQIARAIADVDLVEGADERRGNLPEGYDGPTARADAVLKKIAPLLTALPLLAVKDAEIERLRKLTATCVCPHTYANYAGPEPDCPVHGAVRAFNEASAKVAELTRQLDEAHTSNTRLMAENQSRIHLEVTLRNDIIRLVTAALGTWDNTANADEQIAQAEQRIAELAREQEGQ